MAAARRASTAAGAPGAAAPLPRALPGPRRPRPARHPHLPPPPARHGEPRATPRTEPRTRSRAVLSNSGKGVQGGVAARPPRPHPLLTPPRAHPARSLCSPRSPPRTAGHRPRPRSPRAHCGAHKAPRRARSAHSRRAARSRTRRSPRTHTHTHPPSRSPRTKGPPGAPQGFHAATEKKRAVIKPSANYSPEEKGRPARSPVGVTRSVRAGAGGARRRRSGARGEGSAQRLPPAARFAFYRAAAAAASP